MKLFKYIPVAATAITTTGGLFFLMHSLIATEEVILPEDQRNFLVDYRGDITEPEELKEIERVEPPKEVVKPPETVDTVDVDTGTADPTILIAPPVAPTNDDIDITVDGFQDGEQIPLVRVQATYPRNALAKGLSGWATVAFTIDEYGTVIEPYIVAAEPKGYFERSSLKAIKKFRYKPKVVNGQAVQSQGQFRMVFELKD